MRRADVQGTYFGGEGVVNYVLSPRAERRAQIIETRIDPGGSPGTEFWSHPGELVMATVVEGSVEFRFTDRSTVLQAGDTIAYAPSEPHSWGEPGRGRTGGRALLPDPRGVLSRAGRAAGISPSARLRAAS